MWKIAANVNPMSFLSVQLPDKLKSTDDSTSKMQKPVTAFLKSKLMNNRFATLQGNDQESNEVNENHNQDDVVCEIAKAGEFGDGLDSNQRPPGPG